jgi:hypothetical protein
MKHLFFVIITLSIAAQETSAQRYLPGHRGVQLTAGTVNGLNLYPASADFAFHAGVALSVYNRRTDRWIFGFEYLEKRYPYKEISVPQAQFTLDAGYYLKFYSDWRKMFFLSIGASAMTGYETVNRNKKLLFDGATVNNKDAFLYGGAVTLELETYLTDRLVMLCNLRERFLTGSSVGKFNTLFGTGIKLIIN